MSIYQTLFSASLYWKHKSHAFNEDALFLSTELAPLENTGPKPLTNGLIQ